MALDLPTLFVGGLPGGPELIVILLIAILLFGANKIPKLARSTGQAIGEFQRGREEIEQELDDIRNTADPQSSPGTTDVDRTGTETDASSDVGANVDTDATSNADADAASNADATGDAEPTRNE